jgi:hypothetical protein
MKRCPECYHVYDDQEKFCETDGHELLPDPALSPKPEVVATAPATRRVWWPAAALGIVIGVVFGAGVFAAALLISTPESNDRPVASPATEVHEKALPNRVVAASNSVSTPEPEASPSPDPEQQTAAAPSPAANTDNKSASVQLNQGPISTGEKTSAEAQGSVQTVIEMTDGSTLDVDAAWKDKQGIWYRRSGLVSFVDSSRVKAITTARRETKVAEEPHR